MVTWDVKQAAEYFGIHENTMRAKASQYGSKICGRWRFDPEYLKECTKPQNDEIEPCLRGIPKASGTASGITTSMDSAKELGDLLAQRSKRKQRNGTGR